jgi:DNA sulfur modification protein DndB
MRDIPPGDRSAFLRRRPKEPELDKMYRNVVKFFAIMAVQIRELSQFFRASKPSRIVRKHRNSRGGSLIYRPLGMLILTETVIRLSRDMSLKSAARKVARLPRNLQEKPLRNVLWDPGTKTMVPRNRVLVRKIYFYMLGQIRGGKKVLQKYQEVLDDPAATLTRL